MPKSDEIDPKLAKKLAWTAPGAEPKLDDGDDAEREKRDRESAARLDFIARETERLWDLGPGEAQALGTVTLAAEVDKVGVPITALSQLPDVAVHLLRLLVRHAARFEDEDRVDVLAGFMDATGGRGGAELVIESLRAGAVMRFAIEQALVGEKGDLHRLSPFLGQRLAEVLEDETVPFEGRRVAAFWIAEGRFPDAIPALKRVLRSRYVGLRWPALEALRANGGLSEEDALFLLEDAVDHPVPWLHGAGDYEDDRAYADAVAEAVEQVKPYGGEAPLAAILDGDGAIVDGERGPLDADWALRLLAACYPRLALPRVDAALAAFSAFTRASGLRAAAKLPREEAEPRLRPHLNEPYLHGRKAARDALAEMTGAPVEADPALGLWTEGLAGPPSAELLARLAVLRGEDGAARVQLVQQVLAEPPGPENLALLLYALADASLHVAARGAGLDLTLDHHQKPFALELLRRFGAPAFDGLTWLAARLPGEGFGHPLSALAKIAREKRHRFTPAQKRAVTELAARLMESPVHKERDHGLEVLNGFGAPGELGARLWKIASGDPDCWGARSALEKAGPSAQLDALLALQAEAAFARKDDRLFGLAAYAGLKRRSRRMDKLVRALADRAATEDECARVSGPLGNVRKPHAPTSAWVERALADPASPRFELGARLVPWRKRIPARQRALLVAALASPARDRRSAHEAALRLYASGALPWNDRRIRPLYGAGDPRGRADLLFHVLYQPRIEGDPPGAPLFALRKEIAALLPQLGMEDETLLGMVLEHDGGEDLVRDHLEAIADPELRELASWELGLPDEAQEYWLAPPGETDPGDPEG